MNEIDMSPAFTFYGFLISLVILVFAIGITFVIIEGLTIPTSYFASSTNKINHPSPLWTYPVVGIILFFPLLFTFSNEEHHLSSINKEQEKVCGELLLKLEETNSLIDYAKWQKECE